MQCIPYTAYSTSIGYVFTELPEQKRYYVYTYSLAEKEGCIDLMDLVPLIDCYDNKSTWGTKKYYYNCCYCKLLNAYTLPTSLKYLGSPGVVKVPWVLFSAFAFYLQTAASKFTLVQSLFFAYNLHFAQCAVCSVVKSWNPKNTISLGKIFLRLFFLCSFGMKTLKLVSLFIFRH